MIVRDRFRQSFDDVPPITTFRPRMSLIGAEPGPPAVMSARARWEAGDDLDFQDSDSEEAESLREEELDRDVADRLSTHDALESWLSSGSSSVRPAESAETASVHIPASLLLDSSRSVSPASEAQELEVPASAASDSTYSGTNESFDMSARAGVVAATAESRVLASQRFTRDQPSAIYVSPAFPPSPPLPPPPPTAYSPRQSSSSFLSPSWVRSRSYTEPAPTPTPTLRKPLPIGVMPLRLRANQAHVERAAFPVRPAHTAEPLLIRPPRPPFDYPIQLAGFEQQPQYQRQRTTSYSFI